MTEFIKDHIHRNVMMRCGYFMSSFTFVKTSVHALDFNPPPLCLSSQKDQHSITSWRVKAEETKLQVEV